MARRRWVALLLAIQAALGVPPVLAEPTDGSAATPDKLGAFRNGWLAYLATTEATPLQPGCRGGLLTARGPRRGAVLLIHGFGACPQQFAALAPVLAESGFDVLLARLPGHGLPTDADGREDLADVPAGSTGAARYGDLGRRTLALLAASPGERAVVGFSLGGAVALNAVVDAPGVVTRLVLLAPLVAIRGGEPVEALASGLSRVPGLARLDVKHFGPRSECDGWARAGRAGFCDYELRHAAALVDLLRANRRALALQPVLPPTLLVMAGEDRYVSNAATQRLVATWPGGGPAPRLDTLPDAPHELLTPYENPGRPMTWTPALAALVLRGIGVPD